MSLTRRGLLSLSRPRAATQAGGYWVHVSRRAMACKFEITLPSELGDQVDQATAALDTVAEIEDQLTIFRASSDLSRINRDAFDEPVVVDPDLFALLTCCQTPPPRDRRRLRHHLDPAVEGLGLLAPAGAAAFAPRRSTRLAVGWGCSTWSSTPPTARCAFSARACR